MKYDGRFYQIEKIEQKSYDMPEIQNKHIVMLRKDAQAKLAKAEVGSRRYTGISDINGKAVYEGG